MCDFEDMDLHQVRPNNDEGIEPRGSAGKSMEEVGEDDSQAEDQENHKDE